MPMADVKPGSTGNLFLDTLPIDSARTIVAKLEQTTLASGDTIARERIAIERAFFPVNGAISSVTTMLDGTIIEVSLVGREGFYGIPLVLGKDASGNDAMVQIPGRMLSIDASAFVALLSADAALMQRSSSYVLSTIDTISQFTGCNRLHPINERLARWLLMAQDRVDGDTLFLTHEYLATMLGVRRPGVSIAASALEEAGLIEYVRGRIGIRDRAGLEAAACECYAVANDALERALGFRFPKRGATELDNGGSAASEG